MLRRCSVAGAMMLSLAARCLPQQAAGDDFAQAIRPVLMQNCAGCHNPANPKNRVNFLKAAAAKDLQANRGLWRDVAVQLRNRTMPPVESKLTEDERLRVATWIDARLRETACDAGDYAGAVALRRLNRREYHNTIRDLSRRRLQRVRTVPRRRNRRRGVRYKRRDPIYPSAPDGTVHGGCATDSRPRTCHSGPRQEHPGRSVASCGGERAFRADFASRG